MKLGGISILLLLIFNCCCSQNATFDKKKSHYKVDENAECLYDTDSLLYKKVWRSGLNRIDSIKYYDFERKELRNIITMEGLNSECILWLQKKVKSTFNWNNVIPRDGQGIVVLVFIANEKLEISNVRIIRGIHKSLNNEIKRSFLTIAKDEFKCLKIKSNTYIELLIKI